MSDWVYGIVAVMLFGTVVLQVMPEGTYQKYVRLFLGTLLMLTVTGSLYTWLDLSEENRLSFEQKFFSSWIGTSFSGVTEEDPVWQEPDHWETKMKEQMNQKQENWIRQALVTTATEYGFLYMAHEVQWNTEENWPERLTMWVKRKEEEAPCVSEDVSDMETDHSMGVTEISTVTPVLSVEDESFYAIRNAESEIYYEPSELRPLHQALQVVWQLEEEQIELYWQR